MLVLAMTPQWPPRGRRLPRLPLCREAPLECPWVPDRGPKLRRQLHFVARASAGLTQAVLSVLAKAPKEPAPVESAPPRLLLPLPELTTVLRTPSARLLLQASESALQKGALHTSGVRPS